MSMLNNLSSAALRQAAAIKDKIKSLEGQLAKVLQGTTIKVEVTVPKTKLSAKSAASKGAKKPAVGREVPNGKKASVVAKKKPKISAAGIARIKAAQKARWAKFKAAKVAK